MQSEFIPLVLVTCELRPLTSFAHAEEILRDLIAQWVRERRDRGLVAYEPLPEAGVFSHPLKVFESLCRCLPVCVIAQAGLSNNDLSRSRLRKEGKRSLQCAKSSNDPRLLLFYPRIVVNCHRKSYEIREERIVRVLFVGRKEHNVLFIRGLRVEI